ncbi:MAG: hypothetical protein J7L91_04345 [Candidatus Korarchaeota archaeon]|nr:hypothetical protein [Candidatus Korarchaeota archaeon]
MVEKVVGTSYGGILPIVEELAHAFVESFRGSIDLDSRNSRTWPIRDAFETYLKFYRLENDELRDVIASQILKSLSGEGVNLKFAETFAENFAAKFMKLVEELKIKMGVPIIDPSLRTYLIDAFDYYVVREVLGRR